MTRCASGRSSEVRPSARAVEQAPAEERHAQALTRSPSRLSTAGSSVSAASTVMVTTRMAPMARLTKMSVGTMSMPSRASTTVMPLKNTARLAVAPVTAMASILSRPRARSSR